MFTLHQSSERTFTECQRAFEAIYLDKLPTPYFEPFERGTVVHEAVEEMLRAHEAGRDRLIAGMNVVDGFHYDGGGTGVRNEAELLVRRAHEDWDRFAPPDGAKWVIEQAWALDAERRPMRGIRSRDKDPEGAVLAGVFDLLFWDETGVTVQDWKTSWQPERDEELLNDQQMLLYGAVAMIAFKVSVVTLRKVFLRYGHVAQVTVTMEQVLPTLDYYFRRARMVSEHIASAPRPWPAKVSRACGICPLMTGCDRLAEAIRVGEGVVEPPLNAEQAARLADMRQGLKSALDRVELVVRDYAKEHGPIPISETKALGFRPKNTKVLRYDVDRTIVRLRELGMTTEQEKGLFKFSGVTAVQDVLRKACHGKAERDEAFEDLFDLRVDSSFGELKT